MPDSDFFRRVQSASSLSSMSASGSGASPTRPSLAPSSSSSRTTLKMTLDAAFPIASGSGSGGGSRGGAASSAPGSPTKRKVYGDRFIPNRDGLDLQTSFQLIPESSTSPFKGKGRATGPDNEAQQDDAQKTFNALLKTELFGPDSLDYSSLRNSPSSRTHGGASTSTNSTAPTPSSPSSSKKLFTFTSPSRRRTATGERERVVGGAQGLDSPTHERYSLSPVRHESQKLLLSPKKAPRTLSKVPWKVLDAPDLADDYYLNLIDWSSNNVLAVGLGSCVYTWSAHTSEVKKLCDLADQPTPDSVTSIAWVQRGHQLAIGTKNGGVQIWDAHAERPIRRMTGHTARVGALSWNDAILTSGSHDKSIYHRDVRVHAHFVGKLTAHRQEVCGLKWNEQGDQLASGGNDNRLFVFDKMNESPTHRFTEHIAAIKAIAWSPHQNGILASGGGTADQKLRFWNTSTGTLLNEIDTGSQICNLLWSKNSNELVSTHGFSSGQAQNQVIIWRYPSMSQVATLQGHTYRVLYLAGSPDGQTIVTGAGDETIRFWNAFPPGKNEKRAQTSALSPFAGIR
ncbi:WD40-repeat-containing domain protein [Leucosporidium creatinivorum]|uniref:WD40-repeat-containing domain protein n=1 Tax=Leucosporidium creatinivorum TaxID=106004 RepID=A0A1Y2G055_9BASI|nr:WD40-repeat-containing domain protein [Leucosporidium creatinivorum]